jgi:maltose/maltodextrin transport system permease protein
MRSNPWTGRAVAALATLTSLWAVLRVHAAGESLLAVMLLAVTVFALWTYSSTRTHALRYLFPGVAAALVFVVFPMLYTVGIGFTNYSSSNLLDKDQAIAYLQDQAVHKPGSERPFALHRQPDGLHV